MTSRRGKIDGRRIRAGICYTVPEVAELLGVATGTVRAWMRAGLSHLTDCRPYLIPGDELKNWLKARREDRQQKCGSNEMFCFGCRAPRRPSTGSVHITLRNAKTTIIKGRCPACGSAMNKAGSVAKIKETKRAFGIGTMGKTNLTGSIKPIVNRHLHKEAAE